MSAPRYYAVNDRPVAIVPTPDGGEDCLVFDFATGEMVPDRSYFDHVVPGSGKDVDSFTEAEFEARLAAVRADAGARAVTQLRGWAERLCATTGGPAEAAAALGFAGTPARNAIAVAPVPRGYAKVEVNTLMKTGVYVTLVPVGRLLTRAAFDAVLGAGQSVPMVDAGRLQKLAYVVSVPGAPAQCRIFAGFEQLDRPAQEIMLRRD